MNDHDIYKSGGTGSRSARGLEREGSVWDYCVPKLGLRAEDTAPRTAHGGQCAWRGDILQQYGTDANYVGPEAGSIDIEKVPFRDRLAVQAMMQYRDDPTSKFLCAEADGSDGFAICPIERDPDRPELVKSGWLANHSWDFCTNRKFKPRKISSTDDGLTSEVFPAPIAPSMPPRPEPKMPTEEGPAGPPMPAQAYPTPAVSGDVPELTQSDITKRAENEGYQRAIHEGQTATQAEAAGRTQGVAAAINESGAPAMSPAAGSASQGSGGWGQDSWQRGVPLPLLLLPHLAIEQRRRGSFLHSKRHRLAAFLA